MLLLTGSASVAILASMKEQLDIATHRTGREIDLALRLQMNAKTMRSEQRHVLLAGFNKDEQMLRDAERAIDGVLTQQDRHIRDMRLAAASPSACGTWSVESVVCCTSCCLTRQSTCSARWDSPRHSPTAVFRCCFRPRISWERPRRPAGWHSLAVRS